MGLPYLIRRRAGYYVRVRVPTEVVQISSDFKTHIVRSLHTKDVNIARARALRFVAALPEFWAEVRAVVQESWMGTPVAEVTVDNLIAAAADKPRARAEACRLPLEKRELLFKRLELIVRRADYELELQRAENDVLRSYLNDVKAARAEGVIEGMERALRAGVSTKPVTEDPYAGLDPEEAAKPWHEHLETYFEVHGHSSKTVVEYTRTFKRLRKDLGDKPIGLVTAADLIKFMAEQRKEIKPRQGRTVAAAGTQIKQASALKSFFGWAAGKLYCKAGLAAGLSAEKKEKKETRQFERRPFTSEELTAMFDQPLFTGCKDAAHVNTPGKFIVRDHRFWLPPVAYCSGGRLTELTQARLSDLMYVGEHLYLRIRTEFEPEDEADEIRAIKSLKSENAHRALPIHPILIEMGFLDYVAARKTAKPKDGLLFAPMAYSKFYNERFLAKAGLKEARTSFYSLRHSFKDAIRGLRDDLQDRLMGHASRAKRSGHNYGEPLTAVELEQFFAGARFIPLDHLYAAGFLRYVHPPR